MGFEEPRSMPSQFTQDLFDPAEIVETLVNAEGTELLAEPTLILPIHLFPRPSLAAAPEGSVQARSAPTFGDSYPAGEAQPPADQDPTLLPTAAKVERALQAIGLLIEQRRPLAVAYSAGKDSSCVGVLVAEAARQAKVAGKPVPPILFTHARTGVDNPAMDMVAQAEINRIREYAAEHDLPIRVDIAEPSLNDSWAVRIISGRALPTFANSATRDCSISWKVTPQKRQRKKAFKELKACGEPVVLMGTRYEESASRAARMSQRGELDTVIWTETVTNPKTGKVLRTEDRLSPIAFWTQEDVWAFLSELSSGERRGYTDAKELWDVYRDGGNSSCVVVSDDIMKANAKACGARFGCATCTAVGRDRSLEAMLEADPKYAYMVPLNKLQRFLVDTQYDLERRLWLGRTIDEDGYIAIAPDAYGPAMQRELLRYALTIDRDEAAAAAREGLAPRFRLVSEQQLVAIDAMWSAQGYQPRAFEAIHIWSEIYEKGQSFYPPEIDTSKFSKKIPGPRYLYVGNSWDDDSGYSDVYSGARHLMADFVGATETGGCMHNIELKDGRVVMAMEESDMLEVDAEGCCEFFQWEVGESRVHERFAQAAPGYAFTHYQMLGTISTSRRHLGIIDKMLRRAAWKERHGTFDMSTEELLHRSVSKAERDAGLPCPPGQMTLQEELAERLAAEHAARTAGAYRPRQ